MGLRFSFASVAFGLIVAGSVNAEVLGPTNFTGVETTITTGNVTASGGSFVGGIVSNTEGGPGNAFSSQTSATPGLGAAFAQADIAGSATGSAASPLLRTSGTGNTDTGGQGAAGAMVGYVYNGTGSATVTYDLDVTANLSEPTGTSAFLRAQAAFIFNPEFYNTSYSQHFESSANVADTYNFTQNFAGVIDEEGSITASINPGETIYLISLLLTQAGNFGAIADATSTYTGTLSVSQGTLTSLPVPEPGSVLLIAAGSGLMLLRRRA